MFSKSFSHIFYNLFSIYEAQIYKKTYQHQNNYDVLVKNTHLTSVKGANPSS